MGEIFQTDRRIKLGIWGLGRGANFAKSANFLNIDVVAGCDMHDEIRQRFQEQVPEAFCTADEEEFLNYDMDAVLIATFLPDHAKHSIKCLERGFHVMSEVTAFQTPADAVKLVEAVEKSGKVYNLLENYPFTATNMYLKKRWDEGFFGDFVYGEFEYLHECRTLSYGYNTHPSIPVQPGYGVHNWRAALNSYYYCTHSLGPAMYITGLRPVSVSAVKNEVYMPGHLDGLHKGTAAPAIIKMSNGGLVRNLMGATTNDYHTGVRIWGTKAAAERLHDFKFRIGASGCCGLWVAVDAKWDELGELAQKTGHGGGDFWELYFFAREILTGEPAPWNIYAACDVTMAGLMANRSQMQNGLSVRIPDMRNPEDRELCRYDEGDLPDFDPTDIFPPGHDQSISGNFSTVMTKLFPLDNSSLTLFNNVMDGIKIYDDLLNDSDREKVQKCVDELIPQLPEIAEYCRQAQVIQQAYPDSRPGRTIAQALAAQDMDKIMHPEETAAMLKAWKESL